MAGLQQKRIYEVKITENTFIIIKNWQTANGLSKKRLKKAVKGKILHMTGLVPRRLLAKLAKKLYQDVVIRDIATKAIVSIVEKEKPENQVIEDHRDYIDMMKKVKEAMKGKAGWKMYINTSRGIVEMSTNYKNMRSMLCEFDKERNCYCVLSKHQEDYENELIEDMGYIMQTYLVFDLEGYITDRCYASEGFILKNELTGQYIDIKEG